jgi:HK97 family phage major capsid protein/HK97 family phage prohead protease
MTSIIDVIDSADGSTGAIVVTDDPEAYRARVAANRPPRDSLVRAIFPGVEMRASADGGMPTMTGHFSVFNEWTRIDSAFEGRFMERVAPGAFTKTFKENRDGIRVLLNHGKDPHVGDKPLGSITSLSEDARGAAYEVKLLDTSYNRDIIPGLEAGLYGASFRFRVTKEDFNSKPSRSASNPDAIPERTVREAHVMEFGPVTFPAYAGATAGVRSLTDDYIFDRLTRDPQRLSDLIESAGQRSLADLAGHLLADKGALQTAIDKLTNGDMLLPREAELLMAAVTHLGPMPADDMNALPNIGAERAHSEDGEPPPPPDEPAPSPDPDPPQGGSSVSRKEAPVTDIIHAADRPSRIVEVRAALDAIAHENDGRLPDDVQVRWDDLNVELDGLTADEAAYQARLERVAGFGGIPAKVEVADRHVPTVIRKTDQRVNDIYNWAEIRNASRSPEDEAQLFRDSAMRAVEAASFPQMDKATGQGRVSDLLDNVDSTDKYIAKRILLTGKPAYRRAQNKTLRGQFLNVEEMQAYSDFQEFERTMNMTTGSLGGFGITFDLDPTMVQTSTGAIVPYRRAARVVNVTTNEWRGVTSGGVVASYAAESAAATDNSPTLAQPAALVQKAHAFVPFTMEIQGDYPGLEAELAREIQDAKDVLEAVQFTTGAGTTVFPQGIVTGATVAFTTATTLVLAAADLYGTEFTLAPRFRTNARWFANRAFYNRIRAIDTAGGAQLFTQNLTVGIDTNREGNTGLRLLGYPAEECSGFSTSIASTTKMAVFGDASYFVIVDRVGLNLELVPILFGGAQGNLPTGQRGLYAWWRNTSKVLSAAAFLTVTGL